MGAELLAANGNLGTSLLRPGLLDGISRTLDRFGELGVKGVTIELGFPLLLSSFPNYAQYLAFYQQVAAAVRTHRMLLSVEENAIFANTVFSSLQPDYAGLTLDTYAAGQRTQTQLIIDELRQRPPRRPRPVPPRLR
jgi:hypothetical protein